jgi:adenosylhomocysteine nucleosidase
MKIVVLISANAEWRAVKEIIPELNLQRSPFGEFAALVLDRWELTLFHGGWGKISAAATAQYVIDHWRPDLLLNLGTCGGFSGMVETGQIILTNALSYITFSNRWEMRRCTQHYATELDLAGCSSSCPILSCGPCSSQPTVTCSLLTFHLAGKYGAIAADRSGRSPGGGSQPRSVSSCARSVTGRRRKERGLRGLNLFHQRTKAVMTMSSGSCRTGCSRRSRVVV